MLQIFTTASYWLFILAAIVTLGLLIFKGVQRYQLAGARKGFIVLQAVSAVVLWLVLSVGVLAAYTVMFVSAGHTLDAPPPQTPGQTLSIVALTLAYVAAGVVLVYWVGRRAKVALR